MSDSTMKLYSLSYNGLSPMKITEENYIFISKDTTIDCIKNIFNKYKESKKVFDTYYNYINSIVEIESSFNIIGLLKGFIIDKHKGAIYLNIENLDIRHYNRNLSLVDVLINVNDIDYISSLDTSSYGYTLYTTLKDIIEDCDESSRGESVIKLETILRELGNDRPDNFISYMGDNSINSGLYSNINTINIKDLCKKYVDNYNRSIECINKYSKYDGKLVSIYNIHTGRTIRGIITGMITSNSLKGFYIYLKTITLNKDHNCYKLKSECYSCPNDKESTIIEGIKPNSDYSKKFMHIYKHLSEINKIGYEFDPNEGEWDHHTV